MSFAPGTWRDGTESNRPAPDRQSGALPLGHHRVLHLVQPSGVEPEFQRSERCVLSRLNEGRLVRAGGLEPPSERS